MIVAVVARATAAMMAMTMLIWSVDTCGDVGYEQTVRLEKVLS